MQKNKLFLFAALLISVWLPGCFDIPTDPKMPQWDVDLNVPITNRQYAIDEIIKQSKLPEDVVVNPTTQLYMFTPKQYKQDVILKDIVNLNSEASALGNVVTTNNSDSISVYIPFPDNTKIDAATFTRGTLRVVANNPSAAPVTLTVRIPGILKPDNSVLVLSVVIPAGGSNNLIEDLAGYRYDEPSNQSFLFRGQLWLVSKATSSVPGSQVTYDAFTSNFSFSSLTGFIPLKNFGERNNSFAVTIGEDAKNYRNKVTLRTAELKLKGYYKPLTTPFFNVELRNFKIVGVRTDGSTQVLTTSTPQEPFSFSNHEGDYYTFNATFNETNSNIHEVVSFLPDSFRIAAEYWINPGTSTAYSTATTSDSIFFTADVSTKSIVTINHVSQTNVETLEISDDNRDKILNGQGASLTFEIQNMIPLSVSVLATLEDKNHNDLFIVTKNGASNTVEINGANTDANGVPTTPGVSNVTLTLSAAQLEMLSRSHFVEVTINVSTSNIGTNAPAYIRANDWIKIRSVGSVKYRVKEDDK